MRISDWSSDVCSSDLTRPGAGFRRDSEGSRASHRPASVARGAGRRQASSRGRPPAVRRRDGRRRSMLRRRQAPRLRSEEHTSELESLMRISYAVFGLKKKNTQKYTIQMSTYHDKDSHMTI